ncbi:hypothetical protein V1283_003408 [Bradyrhizobium sp. AZCC 2262]
MALPLVRSPGELADQMMKGGASKVLKIVQPRNPNTHPPSFRVLWD